MRAMFIFIVFCSVGSVFGMETEKKFYRFLEEHSYVRDDSNWLKRKGRFTNNEDKDLLKKVKAGLGKMRQKHEDFKNMRDDVLIEFLYFELLGKFWEKGCNHEGGLTNNALWLFKTAKTYNNRGNLLISLEFLNKTRTLTDLILTDLGRQQESYSEEEFAVQKTMWMKNSKDVGDHIRRLQGLMRSCSNYKKWTLIKKAAKIFCGERERWLSYREDRIVQLKVEPFIKSLFNRHKHLLFGGDEVKKITIVGCNLGKDYLIFEKTIGTGEEQKTERVEVQSPLGRVCL